MNPFEQNALDALSQLLRSANVKITKHLLRVKLRRNPHFPSMASLKDTLSECKIRTVAVRGTIGKLAELPMPALAFLTVEGGIFAPIRKTTAECVEWYHTEMGWQEDTLNEFEQKWNGALLLIEPTKDANERHYNVKQVREHLLKIRLHIIGILLLLILHLLLWRQVGLHSASTCAGTGSLVLIKLVGATVSGILIWRSNDLLTESVLRPSLNITKLYSASNELMQSGETYSYYPVHHTELALVYFSGTFLGVGIGMALGYPVYQYIFLFNLPALAFSLFLLYKQVVKKRKICAVCSFQHILIWFEFGIVLLFLDASNLVPEFGWLIFLFSCLAIAACYSLIKPLLIAIKERDDVLRELTKMKANHSFMEDILKKKSQIPPIFDGMKVVRIGNPHAEQTITLVFGPTNLESAALHQSIAGLFSTRKDTCWQIVFLPTTAQDAEILEAILHCAEGDSIQALDLWFSDLGQSFERWKKLIGDGEITSGKEPQSQYASHNNWCKLAKISVIPSVFINGSTIPTVYQSYDFHRLLDYSAKMTNTGRKIPPPSQLLIITCITNPEDVGYKYALAASCHFF